MKEIESKVQEKLERIVAKGIALDKLTVSFDLGDDGHFLLDTSGESPSFTESDEEGECQIKLNLNNLNKLLAGDLNPMVAYTMGKIKISGKVGHALKLSSLFE